ncbi:hypothetical protein FTV88_0432 [Heliorestis convoluta]|uniref:Uncharacterized protein n=1 Tax=Heliorestis convoluta TaxID=356322 RepID=A0A5Q2MXP5_9FIRM|nr:hypothetical protein FTV88_0432 [Heliorestis convoluta]
MLKQSQQSNRKSNKQPSLPKGRLFLYFLESRWGCNSVEKSVELG